MGYLLFITLGLCVIYFLASMFLPILWDSKVKSIGKQSLSSIIIICISSLFVYLVVFNLPNIEIGNRILHSIGGGFIAFMVCFLVVKDGKFLLTKIQFFILSALIVTALGVANEIVEFFLQNYFGWLAAESINDTWLDLISNTVGILLAGVIFTPFINNRKEKD